MKVRKTKISKSGEILKFNSAVRENIMEHLPEMPEYIQAIERGLPFFTKGELEAIESKYSDDGMTWDEIELEMSGKGIILKYSTFRKYIQDGLIPKANRYKSTTKGRVAIYESNIIRNLNFVYFFYKVSPTNRPIIECFMDIVKNQDITYWDAVESNVDSIESSSGYTNLYVHLAKEIVIGYDDVSQSIQDTLTTQSDMEHVLTMLIGIKSKFEKYVSKDFKLFTDYLETHKILVSDIPEHLNNRQTIEKMSGGVQS
ncbi:MAG: hypothetical protein M0023_01935 [Desulfobacteraceae bacterium]|nr:hypothetical protein [Desulfobacteraceae bacterium]